MHADSAPTFYVDGNPDPLDALTRRLEREVAALTAYNPITDANVHLTQALADRQEQEFLHMVTADPNRTPTFIMFADPDFFLSATYPPNGTPAPCVPLPACSLED